VGSSNLAVRPAFKVAEIFLVIQSVSGKVPFEKSGSGLCSCRKLQLGCVETWTTESIDEVLKLINSVLEGTRLVCGHFLKVYWRFVFKQ
jgi:hypothetical protein